MVNLQELAELFPENKVIQSYMKETLDFSKGVFYLGGVIALLPTDDITKNHMERIKKEIQIRDVPCNSWEAGSILSHNKKFHDFEKLFELYLNNRKMSIKELS